MIDIVYIGSGDYSNAIRVSAESAIRRAKRPDQIRVHVVTDDRSFPDIGYDVRYWDGSSGEGWHGTKLVWSRIDFPSLFPDCDWIVSCDGDTLWLAPPENLWELRDDGLLLQGSRDCTADAAHPVKYYSWWNDNGLAMREDRSYCCGLMLMNLGKMREMGFSEKCKGLVCRYPNPPQCEQTVMCYLAQDESAPLPPEWGVFSFWHTTVANPKLVHYVVDLPWKRDKLNRLVSDVVLLWWKECERVFKEKGPWPGYRGCRGFLDYAWRRATYVIMKPFAGLIDCIGWLRPHFRNARGFSRRTMKEFSA